MGWGVGHIHCIIVLIENKGYVISKSSKPLLLELKVKVT